MPTRLPQRASDSARFTATVVLPTPPLPAPTAMTFFTPASGGRPVSGADAERTFADELHVHVRDTREGTHRGRSLIAQLILDGTRRRGQLDGERDSRTGDRNVLHEAERHDVLANVGVDDDAKRVKDRVPVQRGSHILVILPRGLEEAPSFVGQENPQRVHAECGPERQHQQIDERERQT